MAEYIPNIEYTTIGDRSLKLNLLKPKYGKGPFPLIVYIQGSGWLPQNLYTAIPQLSDFAHKGYVVASVEYRASTEAKFPAQIQDVKAAIRFLRANAGTYKIDPDRVGVWGDSSGGHLASLVGTSEGVAEFDTSDHSEQSSAVKAVVNFYGPTNFLDMNKFPSIVDHDAANSPESLLIGGPIHEHKDKVKAANPITYISNDKTLPPFLILHGDRDEIVPFNQSVLLYQALKAANQNVTFYKVKGAGHGVRFWTKDVLELVLKFFDAYL
jgi:acetyl esterase/lipase